MDWITLDILATVGGAAAAVSLVTALLKQVAQIEGRRTQVVAAILSAAIVCIVQPPTSIQSGLLALLNTAVVLAAAMGLDQLVNYKR
jgi:hypothetical protein